MSGRVRKTVAEAMGLPKIEARQVEQMAADIRQRQPRQRLEQRLILEDGGIVEDERQPGAERPADDAFVQDPFQGP